MRGRATGAGPQGPRAAGRGGAAGGGGGGAGAAAGAAGGGAGGAGGVGTAGFGAFARSNPQYLQKRASSRLYVAQEGQIIRLHPDRASSGRGNNPCPRTLPYAGLPRRSSASTIRSRSRGPSPGWTGISKRGSTTRSATGQRPPILKSFSAFCVCTGRG